MPIGLFLSLFIVVTNDSVGVYKHTKIETTCEKHKLYLKRAISIGFVDFEEQFNEIIASTETEDEARKLIEEDFEIQHAGFKGYKNPIQLWAQEIHEKSKQSLQEGL